MSDKPLPFRWAAVSFDLDGTLYDYDACHLAGLDAAVRFARERLGLDREHFLELYQESRAQIHHRLDGTGASHSRLLYFNELVRRHAGRFCMDAVQGLEGEYWAAFSRCMRLYDGALLLLEQLRLGSVRLALTTDMVASTQFAKLAWLGLRDVFDVVVTSEDAGVEKPDPKIFMLCLSRLSVAAGDIIHVGDDYHRDVEGAREAGLAAVWFSPRAAGDNREAVRSFSDLKSLLCHRD